MHCDPYDDTTKKPNAGVGAMIKYTKSCNIIKSKMITEDFKEAYKTGRAAMYVMDLGWESNMMVFVLYGVSGGGKNARAKTKAIIDAIIKEKAKHPYMACGTP